MSYNCIDVSKYQQNVDWAVAKQQGVEIGIIRVAYRGYAYGNIAADEYAVKNAQGMISAGIKAGLYFFSQAINETEAIEEADYCIDFAAKNNLPCPAGIWFDSELGEANGNGRADKLSVAQRTACARAFVDRCKEKGFIGGIYASTSWFNSKLDMTQLSDVPLWVADYRGYQGYQSPMVYGWQYSSSTVVNYVNTPGGGRVDTNYWYQSFEPTQESNMTKTPTPLKIGFASSGDIWTIKNKLAELLITDYTEQDGYITTNINISYGDKITIEDLCISLGIPCVEYIEEPEDNTAELEKQLADALAENEKLKTDLTTANEEISRLTDKLNKIHTESEI